MANKLTHQEISLFADNELAAPHDDAIASALHDPELPAVWAIYHQIGDVLRSDDMAVRFSPDFAARLAARLDAEPAYLMPGSARGIASAGANPAVKSSTSVGRRLLVPALVAAAAAAYFVVPQAMIGSGTQGLPGSQQLVANQQAGLRAVALPAAAPAGANHATASLNEAAVTARVPSPADAQVVVLRDARIDEYLLAHQRFSPSMYSSAQFARSATFANDASK